MENEIEKSNLIAGGFGKVRMGSTGQEAQINAVQKNNDGSVTITLGGSNQLPKSNPTENAEFEEIKVGVTENDIKEAMNRNATLDELAALADKYMFEQFKATQAKDAEFEIIEPKLLTDKTR